jgi:hypothetical protein
MRALPVYELGPGRGGDELLLNVILYGMTIALLLSMLWVVVVPVVQSYRDRRRSGG